MPNLTVYEHGFFYTGKRWCACCVYYKPVADDTHHGRCKNKSASGRDRVRWNDTCGEHKDPEHEMKLTLADFDEMRREK